MLKFSATVLLLLLAAAACVVLLMYVFQRRLLYPSPPGELPLQLPPHVSKIQFENGYGLLMLPPDSGQGMRSPALVFAHGNGEWAAHWIEQFQELVDAGLAVMLVEYPGYAGAPGKPSMQTMGQMMTDAYDHLAGLPQIDATAIVSHGRSLGGGAACLLAEARPVAALVLESTFSTLRNLVSELRYPSRLLKDRYDNAGIIAASDVPVLIYHGTEDELIGVHHAEALHSAARNSELLLHRCDHNSCPRPWNALTRFLKRNGVEGVKIIAESVKSEKAKQSEPGTHARTETDQL